MRHRTHVAALALAALVAAGCSGSYSDKGNAASGGGDAAKAAKPATEGSVSEGTVKGTVAYRERIALPDDAEAYLWIIDTTPGIITTQVVVAETTVKAEGKQVPLAFTLAYDPGRITADHDYGLKAVIKGGGKTMFETKDATPVITKGKPTEVALILTRTAD
jgi:putative lipoprotein